MQPAASSLISLLLRTHALNRFFFFFFNDTATTEIYTLSLHDALPIYNILPRGIEPQAAEHVAQELPGITLRSEEHTSELQSPCNLVCRLLLEKKKDGHFGHQLGVDRDHLGVTGCSPCDPPYQIDRHSR